MERLGCEMTCLKQKYLKKKKKKKKKKESSTWSL
jgi:hypothetical protein